MVGYIKAIILGNIAIKSIIAEKLKKYLILLLRSVSLLNFSVTQDHSLAMYSIVKTKTEKNSKHWNITLYWLNKLSTVSNITDRIFKEIKPNKKISTFS